LQRFRKHAELGWRWIRCGWRLFLRNPWRLGGMGFCCAALAITLAQIPLIGGPILGLLAPTLLASFYIAIDEVSKQKIKLPPALRLFAIRQSPRELLNVAGDERQLMQVLVTGLYCMIVVVLTDIVTWIVAGAALASPLANLSFTALIAVAAATVIRYAIYLLLAASLVFTLPLALLQKQALVPAMFDSLRRALHYGIALLVIVALWLVPVLLGGLISFYATWIGYLAGLLVGVFVLPISLCSLYCGYRTMFTSTASTPQVNADFNHANVA